MFHRPRITPRQIEGRKIYQSVLDKAKTPSDLTDEELSQAVDYFRTTFMMLPGGKAVREAIRAENAKRISARRLTQ